MRLLPRRTTPLQRLSTGSGRYEVTFSRLMHDIETVVVMADSPEDAIAKAEGYLFANIFARTVVRDGVHLWPPGSRRAGATVVQAAEQHAGRVPDAPVTDVTGFARPGG
jgi:hypothetical protein